jgi:hypothetical protein
MTTPIEKLLLAVEWLPVDKPPPPSFSPLPFATHQGVLRIGDARLRCYRLNTGKTVFDADDVREFFGGEFIKTDGGEFIEKDPRVQS